MTDSSSPAVAPAAFTRRRVIGMLTGGAVISGGAGYTAAQFMRSPAQALADTAPPPPALLTATVERRVLRDVVVVRGRVTARTSMQLTPKPKGAERAILTAVFVTPGQELQPGTVLAEVSGRPLVALPGGFPAYRDLRPGDAGRDVTQMQKALSQLGHKVASTATFDSATKSALLSLYRKIGYPAVETGDPGALRAAEAAVSRAAQAVTEARSALERLLQNSGEQQAIDAARAQLRAAEQGLSEAERHRNELVNASGPTLPLSEVAFVPAFPARIERLNGAVGDEVTEPFVVLSSGDLIVRSGLSPGQRQLLTKDMPVGIASELDGVEVEGVVDDISELTVNEAGDRSHPMVISPKSRLDPKLAGADVRVTVTLGSTGAEVLVVPAAAVFSSPDGRPSVMRLGAGGERQRLEVTVDASGGGHVAVTALNGQLQEGDQVVVGATGSVLR